MGGGLWGLGRKGRCATMLVGGCMAVYTTVSATDVGPNVKEIYEPVVA